MSLSTASDTYSSQPILARPRACLALAGIVLCAAVVMVVVYSFFTQDVQGIDDGWRSLMDRSRTDVLVKIGLLLDVAGGVYVTIALWLCFAAYFVWRRWRSALVLLVAAAVVTEIVKQGMKYLFGRPRPLGGLAETFTYSFPSGHALDAVVSAVIIITLFTVPSRNRKVWIAASAIWVVLMAVSRTYIGSHWLSDVVTGSLIGFALTLGLMAALVLVWPNLNLRQGNRVKTP